MTWLSLLKYWKFAVMGIASFSIGFTSGKAVGEFFAYKQGVKDGKTIVYAETLEQSIKSSKQTEIDEHETQAIPDSGLDNDPVLRDIMRRPEDR